MPYFTPVSLVCEAQLLHILISIWYFQSFNFSYSGSMKWYLTVVLILIFLILLVHEAAITKIHRLHDLKALSFFLFFIVWVHLYEMFGRGKSIQTKSSLVVVRGCGKSGMGSDYWWVQGFFLKWWKWFGIWWWWWLHDLMNILNYTDVHCLKWWLLWWVSSQWRKWKIKNRTKKNRRENQASFFLYFAIWALFLRIILNTTESLPL